MKKRHENNPIKMYESAQADLKSNGRNLSAQHQSVLALARMGSLDLALAQYKQYGLDQIRHNEDVMALGGRLYKDLYLASSGKATLKHARASAAKYEAAFEDTQGFYSGINAATMALIAKMPANIIRQRAQAVLELLPKSAALTAEEYYFIEATRAEAHLLLGEMDKSKAAFRAAINFDPLSYIAHASTLKQFRLILEYRGQDQSWLLGFTPPKPIHFAGHLWQYQEEGAKNLKTHLSNLMQKRDIGFGYGSLAAGADIIMAEALLSEGAELNIFLPSNIGSFVEKSVAPFGEAWIPRFKACLEQALTVTTLPMNEKASMFAQTILASRMAMGHAILRSHNFDVSATQMLILNPNRLHSMTMQHKLDWAATGLEGLEIKTEHGKKVGNARLSSHKDFGILVAMRGSEKIQKYETFTDAVKSLEFSGANMYGLHFDMIGAEKELRCLLQNELTGTVIISDVMAGFVALLYKDKYTLNFGGIATDSDGKSSRFYTLRESA